MLEKLKISKKENVKIILPYKAPFESITNKQDWKLNQDFEFQIEETDQDYKKAVEINALRLWKETKSSAFIVQFLDMLNNTE